MSTYDLMLDRFYHFEKTQPNVVYFNQPFEGKNTTMTWAEVGIAARTLAQKITDMNFPKKSCIGLLSKNCGHWIISDLAILMAGHITVPLYPTLSADTIEYVLDHSEAKLLIVGKLDDWSKQKSGVPAELPKFSFPLWPNEGCQTWKEFIGDTKPMTSDYKADENELATIIYTSGTTGRPKGVVHTFKSIGSQMQNALATFDIGTTDRFFSYLPLAHVAERILIEIGSIYGGSTVSFAESLDTFAKNLADTKPTLFLAVPRIWLKFQQGILGKVPAKKLNFLLSIPFIKNIIKKKVVSGLGLDQAKYCFTGAAAISTDILNFFDRLGIEIFDIYGMTENFAITTGNQPGARLVGSAGKPWGNLEVKIKESGEIVTRSDCNMQGYYKKPEETAETIDSDGWLHTGDKGKFDRNGYLTITGRVKDLFKTSKGKYVAPTHIESHFTSCGAVEQVCVVGSGLPQPLALVVLSDVGKKAQKDELQKELTDLLGSVNGKIENFERLSNLVVLDTDWSVESGMLTPTMKLKRNLVEAEYGPKLEGWGSTKDLVQFR
jgi:long-chain acyl-CoA synthetase